MFWTLVMIMNTLTCNKDHSQRLMMFDVCSCSYRKLKQNHENYATWINVVTDVSGVDILGVWMMINYPL